MERDYLSSVIVSNEQYRALVEAAVRLELIKDTLASQKYVTKDELWRLLGIKDEEEEGGTYGV